MFITLCLLSVEVPCESLRWEMIVVKKLRLKVDLLLKDSKILYVALAFIDLMILLQCPRLPFVR